MSTEPPPDPTAAGSAEPPRAVTPAPTPEGTGARPVGVDERLVLLDVLRGFALGGVFLSNLHVWFSGRIFLPPESMKEAMEGPLNVVTGFVFNFFVFGKFITIFSFLFGLGFALQTGRAEERGAPGGRLYARRLSVMLLLGVAHAVALWYGDILHVYALFGFTLLLFGRLSGRAILATGLVLALLVSPAVGILVEFLPRLGSSPEAVAAADQAHAEGWSAFQARAVASLTSDSYLALVRANVDINERMFLRPAIIGSHVGILGRFLIGAYVGRRRLLHDVAQHRRLFRRLLGWGLVAGVIGSGVKVALRFLAVAGGRIKPDGMLNQLVHRISDEIGALGFAAFYVAAIALLFQRERWRRALSLFAPAGQMALTNYLSQSVLGVLIFCGVGLGLMDKVPGPLNFAIVFVLFSVQIVWSHLWLARFRFGPAEWLWRSLTYGKAQPMRRAARGPEQAARAPELPASGGANADP